MSKDYRTRTFKIGLSLEERNELKSLIEKNTNDLTNIINDKDSKVVHLTGDETINGTKTFEKILVPTPTDDNHAVNKVYVHNTFNTKDEISTIKNDIIQQVPTKVSQLNNDSGFITNTINNLTNYYTKAEVTSLINGVSSLDLQVVSTLPTTDISTSTIYLVPLSDTESNNIYKEYIYINNSWEMIGTTEVDLSGYATKDDLEDYATKDDLDTIDYEDINNAPDEVFISVRDTVSSDTGNIAREIQIGNDKWKFGTDILIDDYIKKEELSTINGQSLTEGGNLTIEVNSISSLELDALLK